VNEACPATRLSHAPVEHENDDEPENDCKTEGSSTSCAGPSPRQPATYVSHGLARSG
jgi:hypothetical protein